MRIDPNTRDVTLTEIEYRELINLKPDMDSEKAAEMSENIGQLNSKDLEQEVDNYIANVRHFPDDEREIVMEIARHFAGWQYQKDRGKFAQIKAKTWSEGFDDCKEQMMKNAFWCEVVGEKRDLRLIDSTERCLFDAERGDWLKIIIVKEDEK